MGNGDHALAVPETTAIEPETQSKRKNRKRTTEYEFTE